MTTTVPTPFTFQSESIAKLAEALAKAQSKMKAAIKDSNNPFFKSKYADLHSVWEAAQIPLTENGLCVIQSTIITDNGQTQLVTTLAHSSGEFIRSYTPVKPLKDDPQSLGSAMSYSRRYALGAICGVVTIDEDDDGEQAMGRGPQAQEPQAKPPAYRAKTPDTSQEAAKSPQTSRPYTPPAQNKAPVAAGSQAQAQKPVTYKGTQVQVDGLKDMMRTLKLDPEDKKLFQKVHQAAWNKPLGELEDLIKQTINDDVPF